MADIIFDETDLPYIILIKKEVVGAFKNQQDRDDCFDFLKEKYSDCEFISKDLE